jgi:hypothetical protein
MATATQPAQLPGKRTSYLDGLPERKIGTLERALGPETYRVLKGIISNPMSIIGTTLIAIFILVALAAPLIIPPVNQREIYDPARWLRAGPQSAGRRLAHPPTR